MAKCHAILNWALLACIFIQVVPFSTPRSLNNEGVLEKAVEEEVASFICSKKGKFPHEQYCEQYYECKSVGSIPSISSCKTSENFLFNDVYNDCDFAYYVHCGSRTRPDSVSSTIYPPPPTGTTPTTTKPTTTAPTTTKTTTQKSTTTLPTTTQPSSGGYNCTENGAFPHSVYCELYYDCWNFESTLLKCPNETLFDVQPEYSGCGDPNTVECGTRIRPGPGFQCPVGGNDGEKYPDPEDCGWFYTCTNSMPIHQSCPPNLYFNKYISVCDFPGNVDCSDRGGHAK